MEELTAQQKILLAGQHQAWLNHPVTKQLKKVLDNHRDICINHITDKSTQELIPDNKIRIHSVQLATNTTIQTIIYDTEIFVKNS